MLIEYYLSFYEPARSRRAHRRGFAEACERDPQGSLSRRTCLRWSVLDEPLALPRARELPGEPARPGRTNDPRLRENLCRGDHAGRAPSAASPSARAAALRRPAFIAKKARTLHALSDAIMERGGVVPREGLTELPGIGPKCATLVLAHCFGKPTIAVDTHVHRISKSARLGPYQNARKDRSAAHTSRSGAVARARQFVVGRPRSARLQAHRPEMRAMRRPVPLSTPGRRQGLGPSQVNLKARPLLKSCAEAP